MNIKRYQNGFTLVELIISALMIAFITGSIMYGIITTNNALRNVELNKLAFTTLSNKMEELKAQVALNRIQDPNSSNKKECIEYNSIPDMVNNRNSSPGCKTVGYFSHDIKKRLMESLNAKVYDIEASIRFKMMARFGKNAKDTILRLTASQLVFN